MKLISKLLCVALVAVPFAAMAADDNSMGCDSVNWGKDVLTNFPNAQKACQDVSMRNGEPFAHYIAKVVANEGETVTVHLLGRDKKPMTEVVLAPNPKQKMTVEGKGTNSADLKKGDKLDLYIMHSRWGLYSDPDSTPMTIKSRRDL